MKWVLIAVGILIVVVAAVAIIGAVLPKNHLASRSSHFKQPPQAIWDRKTRAARYTPFLEGDRQTWTGHNLRECRGNSTVSPCDQDRRSQASVRRHLDL